MITKKTSMMNARLENNVWKLTAQKSLVTAYFQLPIIVLFWQGAGLNMLQIMTLQAVFSISTVVLELPSGIFADLYESDVDNNLCGCGVDF